MKINNLIIVLLLLVLCFSCEEQDENYKQYLTETVYPGKADSLRTYVGIEKVYLAWDIPTDAKAERMVVKYGATDSIVSETIVDTMVVTGLNSGDTYTFEVFSVDKDNNQSIKLYADLYPVSKDWISKNMMLSSPIISPTDGVKVTSLTFGWPSLSNDVMKYKDGLEFTLTDDQGIDVAIDPANIINNVDGGTVQIIVDNINPEGTYTVKYKMLFSPSVDNKVVLDTTPISGELTFVPEDYSLEPIYLLVESNGWDVPSFITLFALEPGNYMAENINLMPNDVMRAFEDKDLASEEQYGFSYFNTLPDFIKTSDDGNDNMQIDINEGAYDIYIETTSKAVNIAGPYNGPIEIPGIVEAEFYNIGGQGVAYNDADSNNRGNGWRPGGPDVEGNLSGRSNLGFTADGEWLIYTVNILETGTYQVDGNLASKTASGTSVGELAVLIDDVELTSIAVDGTGNWGTYQVKPANSDIQLEAGIHKLKLLMRSPGYNFDSIVFTKK